MYEIHLHYQFTYYAKISIASIYFVNDEKEVPYIFREIYDSNGNNR